jgi:hypothetical protein
MKMQKFTRWLKANNAVIVSEYCEIINSMTFEIKGARYHLKPSYSGNKVTWHTI